MSSQTIERKNEDQQKKWAIFFILLEALGFSLMGFFVKKAGPLPVMQKLFFRNIVVIVFTIWPLLKTGERMQLPPGARVPLALRCLFGCLGVILNFWAIDHLTLADANVLNKMAPFFAILLSVFILNERPHRFQLVAVVVAFIGVLFVVRPTSGLASVPALVGLAGGFGAGGAYTYLRKTAQEGGGGSVIVFVYALASALTCVPFLLYHFAPMTGEQVLFSLLSGVAATVGQLGVTKAYSLAPAREISIFDYAQIVFAGLWGWFFFGELPDQLSVIGYAIIFLAALYQWRKTLLTIRSQRVSLK